MNRPALMHEPLAQEILEAQSDTSFKTILGTTMCTDDFYEGKTTTYDCLSSFSFPFLRSGTH